MKKITIKFVQFGLNGFSSHIGFETSVEFMRSVAAGRYIVKVMNVDGIVEVKEMEVGDNLFDYETNTMWEVMEVEEC